MGPSSATSQAAASKPDLRKRVVLLVFFVVWLSDWIFGWTAWLGLDDLGFWLWLIGLGVFMSRSVFNTKLPEGVLTWAWMCGVLGLWVVEVWLLGDVASEAAPFSSDPEVLAGIAAMFGAGDYAAAAELQSELPTFDLFFTAFAFGILGWILGVIEVVLVGFGLGMLFVIRRSLQSAEGDQRRPLPALTLGQRLAHIGVVALQTPVFFVLVTSAIAAVTAGIVTVQGVEALNNQAVARAADSAGHWLWMGGLGLFVLGVLHLRVILTLRWCRRAGLVIVVLLPVFVFAVFTVASVGGGVAWIGLVFTLVWGLVQIPMVRSLWAVRRSNK